jgi:hypothetical protein
MSLLLSLIALVLFIIVGLASLILFLFTDVKGRKWYQLIDKRSFVMAFEIDVAANYLFRHFWNNALGNGGYSFGVFGETISSALGKKQLEKTLTLLGWIILVIINIVDFTKWFKSGHCIASIQTPEQIKGFLKK